MFPKFCFNHRNALHNIGQPSRIGNQFSTPSKRNQNRLASVFLKIVNSKSMMMTFSVMTIICCYVSSWTLIRYEDNAEKSDHECRCFLQKKKTDTVCMFPYFHYISSCHSVFSSVIGSLTKYLILTWRFCKTYLFFLRIMKKSMTSSRNRITIIL